MQKGITMAASKTRKRDNNEGSIRQRADGRWEGRYKPDGFSGKYKYVYAHTYKEAKEKLTALFGASSLTVEKKGKNGVTRQDIIPMLRHLEIQEISDKEMVLFCTVCCQNPSLNPMQLINAVSVYMPELSPDHVVCCRRELYDTQMKIFR